MSEILLLSNPKHRRKKKAHRAKRRSHRRHRKSARRSVIRVRARRNPSSVRGVVGQVVPTIKAGAIGAVGGVMNDLAYGYGKRFLPAMMQSGMGRHATKILSSVVIGMVGNLVLRGKGVALANGAATVAIHEAFKEQLASFAPALPLGALDEPPGLLGYDPGMPVGEYMGDVGDVGEYVEPGIGDLGENDED